MTSPVTTPVTSQDRTTPVRRPRLTGGALRSVAAGIATGALALGGVLANGAPATAASTTATGSKACDAPAGSYLCAQTGDLIDVTLDELHPTQSTLGFDQIYYKLDRYASDKDEEAGDPNKRFDDFCETNGQGETKSVKSGAKLSDPSSFTCTVKVGQETDDTLAEMKTAVVGPGGELYLTDGHHSLTSFLETPDGGPDMHIRLKVAGNLSTLSQDDFWKTMEQKNWVWLHDADNNPITPAQLPQHLGLSGFQDDPYRSLVFFTRDIGYQAPDDGAEFLEFLWGSWLRGKVDLDDYDLDDHGDYLDAIEDASKAMTDVDKDTVIANGETAEDLGQMDEWNDGKKESGGEFDKLSKKITSDDPGKLAYALDYRDHL